MGPAVFSNATSLIACENAITVDKDVVEINPPATYPVSASRPTLISIVKLLYTYPRYPMHMPSEHVHACARAGELDAPVQQRDERVYRPLDALP